MRTTFLTACVAFAFASCGSQNNGQCRSYALYNAFHYDVRPTLMSPSGIKIDPTGQALDMEKLERQTNEVERCLTDAFGSPPKIPPDVMRDAECLVDTFNLPLDHGCLTVKVPDDWTLTCDGSQQILPTRAPDEGCLEKGLTPTAQCPCRYRGGTQDDHIIVTTPSFYIFKDPLIRVVTGCNNPWRHPTLAKCAQPSVPRLP